ncbi:MAG TPA: NAD(P)/FAD-dependent oxidoreductase [Gaiellaceae bacterium]|nr:NAD(P)/FAD-dependent oxidoreductase [Gaiellaceae bacterium]
MPNSPANSPHRVVVVGGGFGGLLAAKSLRKRNVEVTVVDRTNHHLFQPLLYQVATGILSEGQVAPPLRGILRRRKNVHVELAEVTGFDLETRTVAAVRPLGTALELPYDSLIVASGATTSYFGHDELARHSLPMKTIDDALNLRRRIFAAFELAETAPSEAERQRWLTFAVVGGGPTGCEVAGQIAELARRTLHKDFRAIDPTKAVVLLLEADEQILRPFGERLSRKAERDLERIGVEVRTETRVTGIDGDGMDVESPHGPERVATHTVVWAAGVQASPLAQILAEASGAECDRAGRVAVRPDCTLPGHPEVFVIGDAMTLDGLPGVASVATQQGSFVAETIRRRLAGKPEGKPFGYRDPGSMAVIGRGRAIVSFHGLRYSGFLGFLSWLFVHLLFLTGFRNRYGALIAWSGAFIGRSHDQRTFTVEEIGGSDIYRPAGQLPLTLAKGDTG